MEVHNDTVLFLKRLFLCFATCGLSYTPEENGSDSKPWPFPIAASLSHGGRVNLRLDNIPCREFLNLLIFGDRHAWNWDTQGPPRVLYARTIASHGVRLDPATLQLVEVKSVSEGAL